jgi:lipoate-protein ligase A
MIRLDPLRLLRLTLPTAAENVALDEVLLRAIDENDDAPVLRLWELDHYAVVVGRANRVERNVNVEACQRDGVPIIRRFSGGGTVLLGPGALVFSLFLRREKNAQGLANIDAATALVLDRLLTPLRRGMQELERKGSSDIAAGGVKVSGNSQRWLRTTFLHHGTLLYDFDVSRIERYLTSPEREPDYRQGRSHGDFVRNLPFTKPQLEEMLIESWNASLPAPEVPFDAIRDLVRDRYANDEWTFRM